jgi:hypothetical protein
LLPAPTFKDFKDFRDFKDFARTPRQVLNWVLNEVSPKSLRSLKYLKLPAATLDKTSLPGWQGLPKAKASRKFLYRNRGAENCERGCFASRRGSCLHGGLFTIGPRPPDHASRRAGPNWEKWLKYSEQFSTPRFLYRNLRLALASGRPYHPGRYIYIYIYIYHIEGHVSTTGA